MAYLVELTLWSMGQRPLKPIDQMYSFVDRLFLNQLYLCRKIIDVENLEKKNWPARGMSSDSKVYI